MSRRARRLTATLCALVAIASGGGAAAFAFARQGSDEPEYPQTPAAALLSPRRAPDALRNLIAVARLDARLDGFVKSTAPTTCLSVNAGDASVYARNPDQALTPASTLKLTTAAAFLADVGGTGRFRTTVQGAAPDSAGTVAGDIVMVGDGDPLLSTAGYVATRKHPPTPATDLAALAQKVYAMGVRHVTGGIDIVDDAYDNERRVPSWKPGYTTDGDVGPIGALAVDDGFVSYTPRVVAAADPGIAAGDSLRRALAGLGVTVDGPTTRTTHRNAHTLASLDSAPYSDVVAEMLRESDNNTAELLLKRLAAADGKTAATRAAGAVARIQALTTLGLGANAVKAIDGSGLDRSDRTTCRTLLATLTTKPGGYNLEDMLAIAGQTGTLDDRFTTSPLAGRLRAKTGSLDDVTALVGVTDPSSKTALRFAFISNGDFTDAGGKAIQDRLVAVLASYPDAPDAATLAP